MTRYAFVGNRRFVLEEMISRGLDLVLACAVEGSYLQRQAPEMGIDCQIVRSREEVLTALDSIEYDVLISNGSPFILPISRMPKKKYINIHPSVLPDLRGADPVLGSLLFKKDGGATCHLMTDQIDAGDIISQIRIPYSDDLDGGLLYQLSFIAEKKTFIMALERDFEPVKRQVLTGHEKYFTRRHEDQVLTFHEPLGDLIAKIRAFGNRPQGCIFCCSGAEYRAHEVKILKNKFLKEYAKSFDELTVLLSYDRTIIFKKDGYIVAITSLCDDLSILKEGQRLRVPDEELA